MRGARRTSFLKRLKKSAALSAAESIGSMSNSIIGTSSSPCTPQMGHTCALSHPPCGDTRALT